MNARKTTRLAVVLLGAGLTAGATGSWTSTVAQPTSSVWFWRVRATDVGGLSSSSVPVFLLVFGVGLVAGTWLAGELADISVFRSLLDWRRSGQT